MIRMAGPILLGLLAMASTGHAQVGCTALQITPGAAAAIVSGRAPSDEPFACYTVSGIAGKTVTIALTRPKQDVAFNVAGLVDDRESYSFRTDAKTCRIDVYTVSRGPRATPFTMQVSMK
jgi:hypothetical protein